MFAWMAFYCGMLSWALFITLFVGFRHDPYVARWLVFPGNALSLAGCVLAFIARRRVRFSTALHGALDFISSVAWHLCWTSLLIGMVGDGQYYQAYQDEMKRLIEEVV